jgi:hypothetical protein
MTPKTNATLTRDIQDILATARDAVARNPKALPPAEPQEVEEAEKLEVYGLVANGCGRHEAAKENTDFISPLLLAA